MPVLVTHELVDDDYREVGRFTDEAAIGVPMSVTFRLGDLLT